MGVNTKIYLPGNVRVDDVAIVVGALAGLSLQQRSLRTDSYHTDNNMYCICPSVSVQTTSMPCLAIINLLGGMVDGETQRNCYYHFECEPRPESGVGGGWRLLSPKCSSFWIAIGKGLVDFFGGVVDFNDCDDIDSDYVVSPKSDAYNSHHTDEQWAHFQKRLGELTPVVLESEAV